MVTDRRPSVTLFFRDGQVTAVREDAERVMGRDARTLLRQVGDVQTRRASHVEPTDDDRWMADMSPMDGPVLGPFDLRTDALAAEHKWLEANL